jgi:tRNA dimethylallyltransferase
MEVDCRLRLCRSLAKPQAAEPTGIAMTLTVDLLPHCRFLAGPTACGKTGLGLRLAEAWDAEIVSMDSMALYRGMDVGTAKPTAEQRSRVPHHLIDVVGPHEDFSVAEYVAAAGAVCRDVVSRGKVPLFVGGTGLYLRSLLRGVFQGPSADREFRRRMEAEAAGQPPEYLHRLLRKCDPAAAKRLHPHDRRRLIRALEVFHVTGRPLSEQQQQPPLPLERRPRFVVWLDPPREWLHERINRRVEAMFAAGLVDEVRRLLQADPPLGRTARQGLGYKEVIEHMELGVPLEETIERIQTRTRQFAKRQCTWFRNLEECRRIAMSAAESVEQLAERILRDSE